MASGTLGVIGGEGTAIGDGVIGDATARGDGVIGTSEARALSAGFEMGDDSDAPRADCTDCVLLNGIRRNVDAFFAGIRGEDGPASAIWGTTADGEVLWTS